MNIKTGRSLNYRTMSALALIAGALGIAFYFMSDGEILSFMLSVSALGSLIGGKNSYDERDRQLLQESFKTAYEWLLLSMMFLYAFVVLSRWLVALEGAVTFLNSHWPGLIILIMCLLMGLAGFKRTRREDSA